MMKRTNEQEQYIELEKLRQEMSVCFEKDMEKFRNLRKQWEKIHMFIDGDIDSSRDENDKDTSWLDDEQFYCERVAYINRKNVKTFYSLEELTNYLSKIKSKT